MNLILYDKAETEFKTLGIGVLTDIKSNPLITEVLKGEYILEFEYAAGGKYCEYLLDNNIIKALGQPFRIDSVEPGTTTIKVLAKHIVFDLRDNFLLDVAPTDKTAQEALSWILERTAFKTNFYVTGDCTKIASARYVRVTPADALFSSDNNILERFGGEPEYDIYHITMHSFRGKNSNIEIREKKNLNGLSIVKNFSNLITRILPVGKDGLMIPEKFVDSPLIGLYQNPKIDKIEYSDIEINDDISEEQAYDLLREAANESFESGVDKPEISISVDFIELSKTKEYENYKSLETLSLGDTVRVYLPSLKQDFLIRVIKIVKNALTDEITQLELGSEIPTITSLQKDQKKTIKEVLDLNNGSFLEQAKIAATELVNHPFNGHLLIDKNTGELYVMDTTDPKTAKHIWKWGLGGIGFSESGIDGPYKTAWTQDGKFVADFITTGQMSVERIEGLNELLLTVNNFIGQYNEDTELIKSIVGNPIEVDDAGSFALPSISIPGKIESIPICGKNKLKNNAVDKTFLGCSAIINDDKTVTFNGSPSSVMVLELNISDFEPGTYKLIGCPSGGSSEKYYLAIHKNSDSSNIYYDYGEGIEFTIAERTSLRTFIAVWRNYTADNLLFKPMIVSADETDLFYEQFKIGKYDLETVQGVTNHFLPISSETKNNVTLTYNEEDCSYDIVGTNSSSSDLVFMKDILIDQTSLKDKTSYIMSFNQNIDTNIINIVSELHNDTTWLRSLVTSTIPSQISNLTDATKFRCYIRVKAGKTVNIKNLKIQVEEGTIAHNPLPCGRWLEQITKDANGNVNTALIGMNKSTEFIDYKIINNLFIYQDGRFGKGDNVYLFYQIPIEGGKTYTVEKIETKYFRIASSDKDVNEISNGISSSNHYCNDSSTKGTIATLANDKYLYISFNLLSSIKNMDLLLNSIKIYEGYEPYYEIASTNEEKDLFDNGNLIKKTNKVVLTENDKWILSPNYQNLFVMKNKPTDLKTQETDLISSVGYKVVNNASQINTNDYCIYIGNDINIKCKDYTTLEEFKTYLQDNPITIFYPSTSPRIYELSYERLKLHKGYNYITLNDELYPEMSIEYLTDSKFNSVFLASSELEILSNMIRASVEGDIKGLQEHVQALFELCVKEDEPGKLVSMINAAADIMTIVVKKFQVSSDYINISSNEKDVVTIPITVEYDYSQTDIDKAYAYVRGKGTLTSEEIIKYDLNKDGKVTITDVSYMYQIVKKGISKSKPGYFKIISDGLRSRVVVENGNGEAITSLNLAGIITPQITIAGEKSNLNLNSYSRDMMRASLTNDLTLTSTDITVVPTVKVVLKNGETFHMGSNAIRLTENVQTIEVSGQIYFYTGTPGTKKIFIYKNDGVTDEAVAARYFNVKGNYEHITIGPIPIPVVSGDVISIRIVGAVNDVIKAYDNSTWLYAKVVG